MRCVPLVLLLACASNERSQADAGEPPACDGPATSDIPTRDDADALCQTLTACTVCEQSRDATTVSRWTVFETTCNCP